MARAGRFGKRRRPSQNLTTLIASLLREQRAAEDRVMFDAWQNGGAVDGKAVTDERLLGYIKSRRDGFSKDDPLYDEWDNRLKQYGFTIGEQKITLQFKEGKIGAGGVASWYKSQLKTLDKNSAFYREVAGRAADWAKSAAAAARGAARSAAAKALAAKEKSIMEVFNQHSALEAFITEAAQRAGMIAGNQTLTDADATDLQSLFNSGLTFNGKAVTYDMWQQSAVGAYRQFDKLIAVREQAGRTTKELRDQKSRWLDDYLVRLNAVDDRAKYEAARENWLSEVQRAQGDPLTIMEINRKYAETLNTIREGALKAAGGNENDPEFIGGILNEINAVTTGKVTGPTVTDLQSTSGEGVTTSDAEATALGDANGGGTVQLLEAARGLAAGTHYYGQKEPGGQFSVQPYPPAAAFDPTGGGGLGKDSQLAVLNINGNLRQVVLKGTPVNAVALRDANNNPVDPAALGGPAGLQRALNDGTVTLSTDAEQTIGYVFTQPGGKTTYGVLQPDGTMVFTETNPFTNSVGSLRGVDGISVLTNEFDESNGKIVFRPNAGVTPLTVNGSAPGTLPASSFLVDSTVTVADLEKQFSQSADPSVQAYLKARREQLDKDTADRRSEAQFLSRQRSGNPDLQFQRESYQALSPLGALLGDAASGIANVLRPYTAPDSLNPNRTKDDVFTPPPPPTPPTTTTANGNVVPLPDLGALEAGRKTAADAQNKANESIAPGWEPVVPGTDTSTPKKKPGTGPTAF